MSQLLNNLCAFPSSRCTVLVSHDMKLEIDWWLTFLPLFNGVSLIKTDVWSFDDFQFATNACLTGSGATCQDQCFSVVFPLNIVKAAVHITALELFVVVTAVCAWAPLLAYHQFIVSSDNEAAMTVINSGITCNPFMQCCLRQLWFTVSVYDFEICASFVPGDHNLLPDALSRWHFHSKHHRDFNFYCRELALKYTFIDVPDHLLCFQVT